MGEILHKEGLKKARDVCLEIAEVFQKHKLDPFDMEFVLMQMDKCMTQATSSTVQDMFKEPRGKDNKGLDEIFEKLTKLGEKMEKLNKKKK